MAGAIAFDLVMALFPLLILGIGITGYVLSGFWDPTQAMVGLVTQNLPRAAGADLTGLVQTLTAGLLQRRTGYTIAGSVFLLWIATRVSGSLRVALRETLDIGSKRNPLHGKLFDTGPVMIGILLLTLNLGGTALARPLLKFGFLGYATNVATYGSTLGNLATVAVLFFWIYYESLVFILGGDVVQVYTMREASRVGVVSFETGI